MTPAQLAKMAGIRTSYLERLIAMDRHNLEIEDGPVWAVIADVVDERLAALLALRSEMQQKLTRQRKRRAYERARIRGEV